MQCVLLRPASLCCVSSPRVALLAGCEHESMVILPPCVVGRRRAGGGQPASMYGAVDGAWRGALWGL